MGEPGVVETSGLRHFKDLCVLQKSYISDFASEAKQSEASSLYPKLKYGITGKLWVVESCGLKNCDCHCEF